MNWNKIINIFIVIFLIVNVTLFSTARYFENERYSLSEKRTEQLRDVLKRNGYVLYDYVPNYFPMPKIVFQPPEVDKTETIKQIFGSEVYLTSFSTRADQYGSEKQQLIFYKGDQKGVVSYKGTNEEYIPEEFTLEEVERVSQIFAEKITLSIPKLQLTYKKLVDDYYILEYNEVYKGQLLFSSYVTMKVSKRGIEEAKMLRYIPTKFTGDKKPIVPIDESLYNFIGKVKPAEGEMFSIKKIDLGYNIAMDSLSGNIMAEAVPYYRIKLDNDQVYYINAYTNELRIHE